MLVDSLSLQRNFIYGEPELEERVVSFITATGRREVFKGVCVLWAIQLAALASIAIAQDELPTQEDARETLRKVLSFYRSEVGYQGAFLWRYSSDLSRQEGEETASATSGWTQPPGTPTVGEAFLEAYRLSGEAACLNAAKECADALVRSQLQSGGWASHFDLAQPGRAKYAYRVDGESAGRSNYTTFDDNKTQSALTFLMHLDEQTGFADDRLHESVNYSLEQILAAQYGNGAWPQQYREPAGATKDPDLRATFPDTWPREFTRQSYRLFYTLNDNNMSRIIDVLLEAHRIYGREDCWNAAIRTGDFFLKAQLPEPQPGWAQQYDQHMQPVWARKFEPPAVTGGESQSVMRSLLQLYRTTGETRFVATLPRAIQYYRRSLLPDGKLARFYEIGTNKPLFINTKYEITYQEKDLITHYGLKVSSKLDSIERELNKLKSAGQQFGLSRPRKTQPVKLTQAVQSAGSQVMSQLDERGAWLESGKMRDGDGDAEPIIDMRTFTRNLLLLARYAGAQ